MATKTKAKAEEETPESVGAEISNTFGGSPVTSDLPDNPPAGDPEIDLSKAKITVPQEAIQSAQPAQSQAKKPSESEMQDFERNEKSFDQRAMDAGIGHVQVEGIDFRYIGPAPARDKDAKTPNGYPISVDNSRFTPLSEVRFDPSLRFKDPKSGEFYYASDASSFADVNHDGEPLVPTETSKEGRDARYQARFGAAA